METNVSDFNDKTERALLDMRDRIAQSDERTYRQMQQMRSIILVALWALILFMTLITVAIEYRTAAMAVATTPPQPVVLHYYLAPSAPPVRLAPSAQP